ncbi:MAG: hypothetical protein O3A51_10400, partial [Verrucomicrobia bacterium]|nr:hypothetical protein [Verrucomicrobiota bacterium]
KQFFYPSKRKAMDASVRIRLEQLVKDAVLNSGLTVSEIPDINTAELVRVLENRRFNPFRWYWDTVTKFNNFMENVTRLAAYYRAMERMENGDNSFIWASKRDQVARLRSEKVSKHEIAAKLSRELIGDYGNISIAGQYIRKHMIPFWSWQEINAPRYFRLLKNARHEGGVTRVGAVAGLKIARRFAFASTLYAMIKMFNAMVWPEEDEELHEGRRQLHLILGRNSDGSIRSIRFQGAFSDALEWFAAGDIDEDVRDVIEGEQTVLDKVAESFKAAPERVTQSLFPVQRNLMEAAVGYRLNWPELTSPGASLKLETRPVNDRTQHIAQMWSMDWLYKQVMNHPVPPEMQSGRVVNPIGKILFYRTDPGEAAYYHIRGRGFRWLDENGESRESSRRSERGNVLYYYRMAMRWGDRDRARHWLKEYLKMGGTMESMRASVERNRPLGFIPNKMMHGFLKSLSKKDLRTLRAAERWHAKTSR